ncbi:MAG: PmeII family type II restriction endonuclease [Gordonia sp. (in: high G+C Gram-positive bacteria)]|uniref:PmeII family type II restriction endonuclease n=1 Tax=Gordonia sp. (in: high G+C Gram-positive bacteria) TaxID=84139 RepID=UPI003C77CA4D
MTSPRGFYKAIKKTRTYDVDEVAAWFQAVDRATVERIGTAMETYISLNLPKAIRSKSKLADYRTSPYVLMATAGALRLDDVQSLSKFLVDIKLYMGLETSFGKSIESVVMRQYPTDLHRATRWAEPEEKLAEFALLKGLSNEEKSMKRVDSIWREIDAACIDGGRRHLLTIKSGTSTINDTQVGGMFTAIRDNHKSWLRESVQNYGVEGIDVVIGLTYGTDRATNNKENQILQKLTTAGFAEVDRVNQPGVLANADGTVRVSRSIGVDYWAYVANPEDPASTQHAFLEVLLGLAVALQRAHTKSDIGAALNERLDLLGDAMKQIRFPEGGALPSWIGQELGVSELTWLAAAINAFFDEVQT